MALHIGQDRPRQCGRMDYLETLVGKGRQRIIRRCVTRRRTRVSRVLTMPVRCAPGEARKPSLTVEALEDRWLASATGSWRGLYPFSDAALAMVESAPAIASVDMPGLA